LVYLGSDFANPKQQKKYVGADRYGLTLALDKFRNYQLYGIPVSIKFGDLLNLPDFKLYLVSGSEARSIFVELPKMAKINVKKCMI
jgi:hypothetical protein